MSAENISTANDELNQEQLADVSGGAGDSGQYYKLGDRQANLVNSEDDKELNEKELGQVSGGAGDGGQYYRLGDQQNA